MKRILPLLLLVSACASHKTHEGPWILPRGKQIHTVLVTKGESPLPLFVFNSALDLSDDEAHLVALSPFGPTLFRVDDSRTKDDYEIKDLDPKIAKQERNLRRVYSRLREIFWMRRSDKPSELEIVSTDAQGSASELALSLHGYRVDIRVTPKSEAAQP